MVEAAGGGGGGLSGLFSGARPSVEAAFCLSCSSSASENGSASIRMGSSTV